MSLPTSSPKRNQGLDVLRGLAVLLVVINHFEPATVPNAVIPSGAFGWAYWRLHGLGWSGVDCFFVLSGFLISGLLLKEMEQTGRIQLTRFWVRRSFKILPSYVCLLAVLALTGATTWLDLAGMKATVLSFLQHGLFLQNYLDHNPNGPTWSLAVEEHFYLMLPCALLLMGFWAKPEVFAKRVVVLCVTVLVAVLSIRLLQWGVGSIAAGDYSRTHLRVDSLLLGVLIQHLCRQRHPIVTWVSQHPGHSLCMAAPLIATSLFFSRTHPLMFTFGYTALAIGYGLVLIVFSQTWGQQTDSKVRWTLAMVGTWSYNIYLWNFFVLKLSLPGYASAQLWIADHLPRNVASFAQFTLFLVVSLGMGALMTWMVEKPFLKLQAWLQKKKPVEVQALVPEVDGMGRESQATA